MKKYVKPDLFYEDFELSHNIAACTIPLNQAINSCTYGSGDLVGVLNEDETVFNEGGCTYSVDEFTAFFENYCLQTGSSGYSLFTS